jgi:hypothetical protein
MNMRNSVLALTGLMVLTGCSEVTVKPVAEGTPIHSVCIEENPEVLVDDFVPVVRASFARHGITTRVVPNPPPKDCIYIMTYRVSQLVDFAMYLTHAELWLEKNGRFLGAAEYRLTSLGSGGLNMMRWQSTKTTLDPVLDQWLAPITPTAGAMPRKTAAGSPD